MYRILLILWCCMVLSPSWAQSVDSLMMDSTAVTDSAAIIDSSTTVVESIAPTEPLKEGAPHQFQSKTGIFYSLLGILLIFGIFRYSNEFFYQNLFRSFVSTKNSIRHTRTQVGQHTLLHTLMNVLFFIIAGIYLYYVVQIFSPQQVLVSKSPLINMVIFSLGLMLIYLMKIGLLKMLGKLFNIEAYTEEYIFNILLINKVLAVIFFPILCIMVFSSPNIAKIVTILSFVIFGLALLNRYARSRESMMKLLKVNKFHFFIYLCASEILPFAIIGKLILASA